MKDERLKLINENEKPLTENHLAAALAAASFGNELYDLLYQIQKVSFGIPKALMPKTSGSIKLSPAEIAEIREMVMPKTDKTS